MTTSRLPSLRSAVEAALRARFESLTGLQLDDEGRLWDLRPLIVSSIGDAALEAALRDVAQGDGGELLPSPVAGKARLRPPDLHAVCSSCALVLNSFGPWRLQPWSLHIDGRDGFQSLVFERRLKIFPRGGRAPNLDVVVENETSVLAIESKLTEYMSGGHFAMFQPSYERVMSIAHQSWERLYRDVIREPRTFKHLDAGQLVRHYLGLKTQVADRGLYEGKQPALLYLYWEPEDAEEQPACRAHMDEVRQFAGSVSDPDLPFRASTYRELWSGWRRRSSPAWLRDHVRALEERYSLSLA